MPQSPAALLGLAEDAARTAGAELRGRATDWLSVDSEEGHDVKLAADRRSEAILAPTGLPVFSEEAGWIGGRGGTKDYWLVDPLDGTANYAGGVPLCCVSVAVAYGAVVAAFVFVYLRPVRQFIYFQV